MIVGVLRIVVDVPDSHSLKEKRSVVRSLKGRIESRFKVAVSEVGNLEAWQTGELGVVCVTNDVRHADEILAHVADFAGAHPGDGAIASVSTEILHLG
jgi:uncharacterized protein YlxP (DUF503 family)